MLGASWVYQRPYSSVLRKEMLHVVDSMGQQNAWQPCTTLPSSHDIEFKEEGAPHLVPSPGAPQFSSIEIKSKNCPCKSPTILTGAFNCRALGSSFKTSKAFKPLADKIHDHRSVRLQAGSLLSSHHAGDAIGSNMLPFWNAIGKYYNITKRNAKTRSAERFAC